jgi:hypothetical protein
MGIIELRVWNWGWWWWWGVALHQVTHAPMHIRGGWSHYTDASEPVVGYGANYLWSLFNPGFQPATSLSLAQRANQMRYLGPYKYGGWGNEAMSDDMNK